MLTELLSVIEINKNLLNTQAGTVGYTYKDIAFVVSSKGFGLGIDVSWNGFRSSWKYSELKSTRSMYDALLRRQ